mgnify:CR=1 FL=1
MPNNIQVDPNPIIPLLMHNFDPVLLIPGIFIGLVCYIIAAVMLYLLAKKLKHKDAIWAFVPGVNVFLFFELAESSGIGGCIALLVPVLNFIVILVAWSKILKRLGRQEWECIFLLIPVVNIIYLIYIQ